MDGVASSNRRRNRWNMQSTDSNSKLIGVARRERNMRTNELQGDVLAVETHSGRAWALLILPALVVPAVSLFLYPDAPARVGLIIVALIGAAALALVFSGFQYRFLRHGVEVRTLGFRLRAIPRQSIVSYSIETWSLPRGYGIRGIGSTRAYVWGNKVVHIKTTTGDIFLGHRDPERIIRDLNQVTGRATSNEIAPAAAILYQPAPRDSMTNGLHKALIAAMWLFLVSTAFNYWRAWDQLPTRVAVHFDANWQPNGYTSREGALYLGLGIMAFLLVLFTVGALIADAQKPTAFWPMLIFFYAVLGVCWYGNNSIIHFNLKEKNSPVVGRGAPSSSLRPLQGQGGDFEFRVNIPTLSQTTRQGWGTLDDNLGFTERYS